MATPINIFITYSNYDSEFLHDSKIDKPAEFIRVLTGLEGRGIHLNYDKNFLIAGDYWDKKIEEQLTKCDIMIPILSDDFMQSKYCNHIEMKAILEKKLSGEDVLIAPFYYKYCAWNELDWIANKDIRPSERLPFQSIENAHKRTKAIIEFRNDIIKQAGIIMVGKQ